MVGDDVVNVAARLAGVSTEPRGPASVHSRVQNRVAIGQGSGSGLELGMDLGHTEKDRDRDRDRDRDKDRERLLEFHSQRRSAPRSSSQRTRSALRRAPSTTATTSGSGSGSGSGPSPGPVAADATPTVGARTKCSLCRKKLRAAISFKCRCGAVFCSAHRYSDRHECSFDYKEAARTSLLKDNPLVKKDKLLRL
eukprot:jgi/Hompol1/3349/HPOL_006483-RA